MHAQYDTLGASTAMRADAMSRPGNSRFNAIVVDAGNAAFPSRCRSWQKYNEEHGIEPATVIRSMESDLVKMSNLDYFEIPGGPSSRAKLDMLADEDIDKAISRLTKEMKDAAKNLDFEKAADIRDKLRELKELRIFV
jgi:excinuclease UvrABC helicase subunit UvrB